MADQLRHDTLGCAGHPLVKTPHIDGLAARGSMLANAFCTSPLCGPSRVSFFTGTYPHTNGAFSHPNGRHRSGKSFLPQIEPGIQSLVGVFRDAGYRTHGSGYNGCHVFDQGLDLSRDHAWTGFQTMGMDFAAYEAAVGKDVARQYHMSSTIAEMWEPSYANAEGHPFPFGEENMLDSLIAADAANFLATTSSDQPFFLYCGFRAPHTPWCPPSRFHAMYSPDDVGPLPEFRARHHNIPRRLHQRVEYFDITHYPEDMVRRSIAGYYGFVSYLDDCVGKVLQALEQVDRHEETIVVFTSDHGEMLYRHGLCEKQCFYEDAVRVPLIFHAPSMCMAGAKREQLTTLMDVMPTLLATADLDSPGHVEGLDMTPVFRDSPIREHVKSEFYHSLDPCRMVRDSRYKFIDTQDDICELYDLKNDPDEMLNLAWYPQYREVVEHYLQLVHEDWEVPDVPLHATWNDLSEWKQKQRLEGLDIIDTRPPLPEWASRGRI